MADPIASTDPTKKLYTPVPPAAPPKASSKAQALDLEYIPPGPSAVSWKPPPTATNSDPALWPDDILDRNYGALRTKIAANPKAATKEDHALLTAMEKVLHERQGSAKESPHTPVAMLADSGVTLGQGIAKAHMTTEAVEKYVREYTAYVASRKAEPKYAALHSDALANGPQLIGARRAADEKKQVDNLRLAVGQMMSDGKTKSLQVPMPIGLQPSLMVSTVSIPVAQGVDAALGAVPVVGQLFTAVELATGKTMGGLGTDIPETERLIGAVLLVVPHAAKLLAAGAKSAPTIVAIATRTGKTTDEVIGILRRARTLEKDAPLLAEAAARMKAGKPLSPAHEAALARAEGQLQFKVRRYEPTITADASLPAGEGATDKYGNVTFSPLGSKQDIALAKAHESVHALLSPKTLNGLREVRASVRMAAYQKSSALRYIEEAAAEAYAQCKVKGLSWENLKSGLQFPVEEGYVVLRSGFNKVSEKHERGVYREVALGVVTVAGAAYTAVFVADKATDAIVNAPKVKK